MPGLGQWRLQLSDDHKCWVCDQHIYTLIFLTESFVRKELGNFPKSQFENMLSQIKKFNPLLDSQKKPLIFSTQSNWIGTEVLTLQDYCYAVEPEKPPIFEDLKSKFFIGQDVETLDELTPKEKLRYDDYILNFKKQTYANSDDIKRVLLRTLNYRKP